MLSENISINSMNKDIDVDNHKHTATVNVSEIPEGRNVGEVTPFGVCTCALLTAISVVIRPNREAYHSSGTACIRFYLQLGGFLTSLCEYTQRQNPVT